MLLNLNSTQRPQREYSLRLGWGELLDMRGRGAWRPSHRDKENKRR
jgi:hypothetical protein